MKSMTQYFIVILRANYTDSNMLLYGRVHNAIHSPCEIHRWSARVLSRPRCSQTRKDLSSVGLMYNSVQTFTRQLFLCFGLEG